MNAMRKRTLFRLAAGTVAAGAATLAYASLIERNAFVLRRFEVPVLPSGAEPLRVLHLSDIHLLPRQKRKAQWLRRLESLDPDFIVNTGDNIASHDAVPAVLDAFGALLDRPGVFALGSNDYFAPKLKNPLRYLTRHHAKGAGESERLPTADAQGEPLEDALVTKGLVHAVDLDERIRHGAHSPNAKSVLVRRKSAMRVVIEVMTTVRVVAAPTPCVPPRVRSPLWQAMSPIKAPKKTVLMRPPTTSLISTTPVIEL